MPLATVSPNLGELPPQAEPEVKPAKPGVRERLGNFLGKLRNKVYDETQKAQDGVVESMELVKTRGAEVGLGPPIGELQEIQGEIAEAQTKYQGEEAKVLGTTSLIKTTPKEQKIIDLSPENIRKSQENYIAWRRNQSEGLEHFDFGYDRAIEPGRAAVWGHATSLEGGITALTSGEIKSAKAALLEGERLAHAPKTRVKTPPEGVQKGLTFQEMTPQQQKEAADWAISYVSGTLGKLIEGYTPSKTDTSLQAGFVFPLEVFRQRGLKFRSAFAGLGQGEEITPAELEESQERFKHFPNKLFSSETFGEGAREINFLNFNKENNPLPTKIPTEGGVLLIREDKVETIQKEIERRMLAQGKSQDEIKRAWDQIVGFPREFKSIDEALGWLTNTPEGRQIVFEKTGFKLEIPQPTTKSESEYLREFTGEWERETERIFQSIQRLRETGTTDEESIKIRERELEFRKRIIDSL